MLPERCFTVKAGVTHTICVSGRAIQWEEDYTLLRDASERDALLYLAHLPGFFVFAPRQPWIALDERADSLTYEWQGHPFGYPDDSWSVIVARYFVSEVIEGV